MKGITLSVLLAVFLLFSCKKENDNPQWNVNFLGPLAKATLGIENLIGDSSLSINPDGAVSLIIDTTFSNFKLDSVYTIPDTTILTTQVFPPFPLPIDPGTPFIAANNP